jgi:type I restriction enzyme M protein
MIMARVMDAAPGMEVYDPCCGSGGLLIKCEIAMEEAAKGRKRTVAPLKLYGQEYIADTLGHGQHEHDHPRHGGSD